METLSGTEGLGQCSIDNPFFLIPRSHKLNQWWLTFDRFRGKHLGVFSPAMIKMSFGKTCSKNHALKLAFVSARDDDIEIIPLLYLILPFVNNKLGLPKLRDSFWKNYGLIFGILWLYMFIDKAIFISLYVSFNNMYVCISLFVLLCIII